MSKKPAVKSAVIVTLPMRAKPSKAVARPNALRPLVESAWLEERDGTPTLAATDMYKMVLLPVEVEGTLEPGPVSGEALRAVEKSGTFEVGEHVEPLSKDGSKNGVLFRRPDTERPEWLDTVPWPAEPKRSLAVGLNAKLLLELAEAIGAGGHRGSGHVLKLTFDLDAVTADGGWLKPIVVETLNHNGARGLLMPVRLSP